MFILAIFLMELRSRKDTIKVIKKEFKLVCLNSRKIKRKEGKKGIFCIVPLSLLA